jgi:LEA14-like dessication related protein
VKNNLKALSIFILTLIILSAGFIYFFREHIMRRFIPSVEQIGDIQVLIRNDTAVVSSQLIIKNNAFIKIKLDSIKYRVELFEKTYLKSEKALGVELPVHGSDTLDFSLNIPYIAVLKDLKAERAKDDSASYSVNVVIQYTTLFGSKDQPINRQAKIRIPQPPELRIMDIKYEKVERNNILAKVKVNIINHGPINLSVKELKYTMTVFDQGNLKGDLKERINIKPNGNTEVELPVKIEIEHIGRTLFQILTDRDKYHYTLKLDAVLISPDVSGQTFHLDLIKKGKVELKK